MKHFLPIAIALVLSACTKPAETLDQRIDRLGKNVRCPVCRGVSIAESPSDMAKQMLEEIRAQVQRGKSDKDILNFFEERYGEWVLLEPKPVGANLIIWILPSLVVVGGAAGIIAWAKREQRRAKGGSP